MATPDVSYSASGNLMLVSGNSPKQYYFRLENEIHLRYYTDRESAKTGRPQIGTINLNEVGEFKPYNKPIRVNSNIYYVIHLTGNGKGRGWTFGVHGAGRLVLWIKALHRACCLPAVRYVVNTKLHIWAVDELPQGDEVEDVDKVTLIVPDARLYLPGDMEAIAEVTFGPGSLGLRLCTTRAGTAVHHVDAGGAAEARGVQIGDLLLTVGSAATAGMPWRTVYQEIMRHDRPLFIAFGKNKTTGGKPVDLSQPSTELSPEKQIGSPRQKGREHREPRRRRATNNGPSRHEEKPKGGLRRSLPKAIRTLGLGKKSPTTESGRSRADRGRKEDNLVATRHREIGAVLNANMKEAASDRRSPVAYLKSQASRYNPKGRTQGGRSRAGSKTSRSENPHVQPPSASTTSSAGGSSNAVGKNPGGSSGMMPTLLEGRPSTPNLREMRSVNLNFYQNKSKSAIKKQQPRWKVTKSGQYQGGVGDTKKFGNLNIKVGKGFKIGKKPWLQKQVVLRDNGLFFIDARPPSVIIPRNSITVNNQAGRPSLAAGLALERILFVDFVLPGGKAAEPIPAQLCLYIGKDNAFTVHTATHIYAFSSDNAETDKSWIEAIVSAYNEFLQQQQKLIFAEALALRKSIVDSAKQIAHRSPELKPLLSRFKVVGEKPIAVDREVVRRFIYFLNKQFAVDMKYRIRRRRMATTFIAWHEYVKIVEKRKKML